MSYTIVPDQSDHERILVNHINEVVRHCRIGKIVQKIQQPVVPTIHDIMKPRPFLPSWPFDPTAPPPMFMDKCGCRVGSPCGNVACPHRPQIVCATPSHGYATS